MPTAHDIDYQIHGHEMQFVEIELDPGESAVAEAGSLMYKDPSIEMTTVFGDGSGQTGGFMGLLVGAGKRVLTGESLFTTVFTHKGTGKARVAFAAPYPGTILALDLDHFGGKLICQKDAFLAAAKGVSIGIAFQKRMLTGLFGGEGFIMQKLEGDGWVFVHAGGTLVERELKPARSCTSTRAASPRFADRRLRRRDGRRREVDDLRRRGRVLRAPARARARLAAEPAVLAPRGPHHGEPRAGGPAHRRRLAARGVRQHHSRTLTRTGARPVTRSATRARRAAAPRGGTRAIG